MNCLKHKNENAKSYREAQGFMLELLDMMAYAYALELHEQFGFGMKRCERIAKAAIERVHACIERYDADYTQVALKSKCADFGFVSKIKLDKKGAVTWNGCR